MRKWFPCVIMIMLICCLTGCESNSKNDLDQKELVYGYEKLACMDRIEGEVMNFDVEGDFLYFSSGEYEEGELMGEEIVTSHFYKCKTDGSELVELPIQWDTSDFEWLHTIEVSGDGTLWLLFSSYSEKRMMNTYILRRADENGTMIKEVDIADYMDVEDFYVSDIKTDTTGNLYICSGYGVMLFDDKGEFIGSIEENEYIENLIRTKTGEVWAGICQNDNYVLKYIDPAEVDFGKTYDTALSYYDHIFGIDGAVHDFYYRKDDSLFGYDLATEETEGGSSEVLHFLASGLDSYALATVQVISEDAVLATYGAGSREDEYGLYLLQKKDPKDLKIKKIVTYASLYKDDEIRRMALRFNRSQDEYLVITKDYENAEDSVRAFYKDLCADEVIDIVDFSGMASSEKYMTDEMFVDLYSFMERDGEVKKEDFSEHVLAMMETDGKLYHITPTYGINALVAKESNVTVGEPLTFERISEMEKDGAKAFCSETKSYVCSQLLAFNYNSYINWEEGTCSFDSEEFIEGLKYCNTYPEENDYSELESLTSKVRDDEILFASVYCLAAEDLQIYKKMFDEDIALIGYPSGVYSGAALSLNQDFAIRACSKDQKGAWEFLKTFLSREYGAQMQDDTMSVPVRKDSLEDKIRRYTATEEYTDEFGNQITPISYEWANEEIVMEVKALDKEQEALYRDIVQRIDHQYVYDMDVQDIVSQETMPYFRGEISAEEAAANIQERVLVYMQDFKTANEE